MCRDWRRDKMWKNISLFGYIRIVIYALLAVVTVRYGLFIKKAATGSSFYRFWLLLGAVFTVLLLCVVFRVWAHLPKPLRIVIAVLVIISAGIFTVVEALIFSCFHEPQEEVDYLIVLGAQVKEDGPSLVLRYRLDSAVSYLKEHPDTLCIVSGGQGENEPFTEAEGMRRYLTEHGIDAARIIMEAESENTAANLKNCKALLPSADVRVGIVTNNFHIFRSVRIAKKQGYTNVSAVVADSKKEFLPTNSMREFFGVMKDFLFGNM